MYIAPVLTFEIPIGDYSGSRIPVGAEVPGDWISQQGLGQTMSSDPKMVVTTIAERIQRGRSPPLRRRRTKDYIPNSRTRQRAHEENIHEDNFFGGEDLAFGVRDSSVRLGTDGNMNSLSTRTSSGGSQPNLRDNLRDILRVLPDDSHLTERYEILKAENKILRERLQNALQREMKALKTFKRLAKENRQLKLNLRKYERTLLGFYDDETGKLS